MKRTLAATLLMLTTCAAVPAQDSRHPAAQGARRVSAARASKRAKERSPLLPRVESVTVDKSIFVDAADVDEVDKLLDFNERAEGGAAKLLIHSRIMRGRVEISISDRPGTYESYEKAPHKKLEVLNAPAGQFIQGADGGSRWVKSPWDLSVTLPEEGESREGGAADSRGGRWRRYFSSASMRGTALVEGHRTIALAATPKGGRPMVMYFDADTGLLRKQELAPRKPAGENELLAVIVDSYAKVDGVSVPTLYRHFYPKYTLTFRIYEVKHNVPIDDALFRDPNAK